MVDDEAIKAKVRSACNNTVKRAIEFESPELITLASEAMKRNIPAEADRFKSDSEIKYALGLHEVSRLPDLVNFHVKKFIKNDAPALHALAKDLDKYVTDDKACTTLCVELAGKAADNKEATTEFKSTYAQMMYKYGKKEEAVQYLDEELKKIESEESKDYQALKALQNKMINS